jgi:hypothetical protein
MATAVKKTISLPFELARDAENMASEEGKTLSAVVQDALRLVKKTRLKTEFVQMQNYWSKKAKEKGILNEKDLQRYLKK